MLFRKNYLMGNAIKEILQYSQRSCKPVSVQRHISATPDGLWIPAGWFAAMWPPHFPFQWGFAPTQLPASSFSALISDLLLLSLGNKLTQVKTAHSKPAAAAGAQNEERGASPCTNGLATQPAAGVADQHAKKQAENGFAIVAGTKAPAAVAIEAEGWKGYTHTQTTASIRGWQL